MKQPKPEWMVWLAEEVKSFDSLTDDQVEYFLNNYIQNYRTDEFKELSYEISEGICLLSGDQMVLHGHGNNGLSIDHVLAVKEQQNGDLIHENVLKNLVPTTKSANSSKGSRYAQDEFYERVADFNQKIARKMISIFFENYANRYVADTPKLIEDADKIRMGVYTWKSEELQKRYNLDSPREVKKYFRTVLDEEVTAYPKAKVLRILHGEEIMEKLMAGGDFETITKGMGFGKYGKAIAELLAQDFPAQKALLVKETQTSIDIQKLYNNKEEIRAMVENDVSLVDIEHEVGLRQQMPLLKLFIENMKKEDEFLEQIDTLQTIINESNVENPEIAKALKMVTKAFDGSLNDLKMTGFDWNDDQVTVKLSK